MTATLLGVVIAVIKGAFQWPVTDYLIIIEAGARRRHCRAPLNFSIRARVGPCRCGLERGRRINYPTLSLCKSSEVTERKSVIGIAIPEVSARISKLGLTCAHGIRKNLPRGSC